MHFTTLLLLPLPLLILTHPVILEHQAIAHHIQNHVDPLHPIHPRCVTIRTRRSLIIPEQTMKVTHHTNSPHSPSNSKSKRKSLLFRTLTSLHLISPHTTQPHSPNHLQPKLLTRTLSRRDSVTISISSTMNSTQICNSQNDISAKFEVVNNAKNADISVGDDSQNNTSNFSTFGNKNMMNSTGSNTGGWNTKNRDSNLTIDGGKERERGMEKRGWTWMEWFDGLLIGGDYGRWEMPWRTPGPGSSKGGKDKWGNGGNIAVHPSKTASTTKAYEQTKIAKPTYAQNPESTPTITIPRPGWGNKTAPHHPEHSDHGLPRPTIPRPKYGNHTWDETGVEQEKRDIVNLDIVGGISSSTMTRSGNNNTVEVYVLGNGDNVVNVTVVWEGAESYMKDSGNGNTVRVYIGDSNGVDMGDSTLKVIGGE